MKKAMKGFTLVEIMIVVAIIAILAAVAIPNFVRYRKTSQMNACISNLKQLQAAVEQAKMSGVATPTWADIIGSDKYIKVTPTCPGTGTYTLPSNDTDSPTCSSSDSGYVHALPTAS
jgi:prepilin-type N-terminal cleavage/methylation domain-containing protein